MFSYKLEAILQTSTGKCSSTATYGKMFQRVNSVKGHIWLRYYGYCHERTISRARDDRGMRHCLPRQ